MNEQLTNYAYHTSDFSGLLQFYCLPMLQKRADQAGASGFFTRPKPDIQHALLELKAYYLRRAENPEDTLTEKDLEQFTSTLTHIYQRNPSDVKSIQHDIRHALGMYIQQEQNDLMVLMSREPKFAEVFPVIEKRIKQYQAARPETGMAHAKQFFKAINWILMVHYGRDEVKRAAFIEDNPLLQTLIQMQNKYPFTISFHLTETVDAFCQQIDTALIGRHMARSADKGKGEEAESLELIDDFNAFKNRIQSAQSHEDLTAILADFLNQMAPEYVEPKGTTLREKFANAFHSQEAIREGEELVQGMIDFLIEHTPRHPLERFRNPAYDILQQEADNLDVSPEQAVPVVEVIDEEADSELAVAVVADEAEWLGSDESFQAMVDRLCQDMNYQSTKLDEENNYQIDTEDGHRLCLNKTPEGLRIEPIQFSGDDDLLAQHVSGIAKQVMQDAPLKAVIRGGSDNQRFELFKRFTEQGVYVESWDKDNTQLTAEQQAELEGLESLNADNKNQFEHPTQTNQGMGL